MRAISWAAGIASAALLFAAAPLTSAGASPASWRVRHTPALPDNFEGSLAGVSCPATNNCFAVGAIDNPDDGTQGGRYLLHWNGTAWSTMNTPAPAGHPGLFSSVSCSATNACTAVGTYLNNVGHNRALIERWNGTTWSLQSSPVPASGEALIYTVACPSATSCFAAGWTLTLNTALIEHWNGSTWALQTVPHPNSSRSYQFFGLSCSAINACTAVGGSFRASGTSTGAPLVDRWNGLHWTQQTAASPPSGRVGKFADISCPTSAMCLAVGETIDPTSTTNSDRRLAQQWNGGSWSTVITPVPSATGANFFEGVSCPTASACVVVGAAGWANGPPLAERWTGGIWSVDHTATVGSSSFFSSVTCTTTLACTTVGSGEQAGGPIPLVETSP